MVAQMMSGGLVSSQHVSSSNLAVTPPTSAFATPTTTPQSQIQPRTGQEQGRPSRNLRP
jgi:hypothetical protein